MVKYTQKIMSDDFLHSIVQKWLNICLPSFCWCSACTFGYEPGDPGADCNTISWSGEFSAESAAVAKKTFVISHFYAEKIEL